MESSIRVDFRDNGNGLQPVIAVKLIDSDDTRDALLKTFFQSLGGQSSWLRVEFDHHIISDVDSARTFITIYPVKENEIETMIEVAKERFSVQPQGVVNASRNPIQDRYYNK